MHIRYGVLVGRAEPNRIVHRASHRVPGDDRLCPDRALLDAGDVRSLCRARSGAAPSRPATAPPRGHPPCPPRPARRSAARGRARGDELAVAGRRGPELAAVGSRERLGLSRSYAPRGNALPDAPRRRTRAEDSPIERTQSVQDVRPHAERRNEETRHMAWPESFPFNPARRTAGLTGTQARLCVLPNVMDQYERRTLGIAASESDLGPLRPVMMGSPRINSVPVAGSNDQP